MAFPIRKSAILGKLKEINDILRRHTQCIAHEIPQIDAEIAQKGHFRLET